MTYGLYTDGLAIQFIATVNLSVQQVECLVHLGEGIETCTLGQLQSDNTQMETMRIHTIPVGGIALTTGFVELNSIGSRTTMVVIVLQCFAMEQVLRIGKAVPSPIALCAEGHTFGILLREGLKSRSIYRNGKTSITNRERRQCVECRHMRIVTLQQCLTVNGGLFTLASGQSKDGSYTYINYTSFHVICFRLR